MCDTCARTIPTERNGASVQMLADLGFEQSADGPDGASAWVRPLALPFPDSDVVRLVAPAGAMAPEPA